MDKKTIAILLVASSFTSSAFATNFVNKLISKHKLTTSSIKTHKATKQTRHSFVDFSGSWVGDCGDGDTVSVVIENGDDYISFEGYEFRIGKGLQGEYRSDEEGSEYGHVSFEWNKEGSALVMKDIDVIKDNMDNSSILTIMSAFNLSMNNGQMILDGKINGFNDLTQIDQPLTEHCVFTKSNGHSR